MKKIVVALSVMILGASLEEAHAWSFSQYFWNPNHSKTEHAITGALFGGLLASGFLGWHFIKSLHKKYNPQQEEQVRQHTTHARAKQMHTASLRQIGQPKKKKTKLVEENNKQRQLIQFKVTMLSKLQKQDLQYEGYEECTMQNGYKNLLAMRQDQTNMLKEVNTRLYNLVNPNNTHTSMASK